MKAVDGASYVYSGVTEGRAKRGVAIIVAERWADCVRSWRCVSERCVTVRLNVAGVWLTLVQVYAPTDDTDSVAKDEFYAEVQEVMNRVPRGDRIIVMGDFNARVGKNVKVWKGVIGEHGEDVENDSGRRLLGFSAENEMKIMNTHFGHKRIHKFTWSCLDYFLVRSDQRRYVHDVRVIRGAEIESDHYLVLAKVNIAKQVPKKTESRRSQLRSERLQTLEGRLKFRARLRAKWNMVKQIEEEDVDRMWEEFKGGILGTAEEVCGRRKRQSGKKRTGWWGKEVEAAIRKKKMAYKRWLQVKTEEAREMYLEAKKGAKQVVRKAKNEEWIKFGESLQVDFVKNQRNFWGKIRATVKGSHEAGRVCDENGQVICEEDQVRGRWKEYFASLFQANGEMQQRVSRDVSGGEAQVEENVEEITIEEVQRSIARLKSRKTPGVCEVSGEMLKAGGEVVVEWLHRIMNRAWKSGMVPDDWRKALVVPVHKKGSKLQCKNYRGISLLSIPGKVYAKILEKRLRNITEDKILEEQGAFRKKRSCTDQLFTVRMLSEKTIAKNKRMIMVCVDLEKAYDNVNRDLMWNVLEEYGIRGRLAKAVRSMYVNCEACVRVLGGKSDWFKVEQGVRQGCVMSPWLFNLYMDHILREAKERFSGGVKLEERNVQFLLFADDLMLVAEMEEDVERNLQILDDVMAQWQMKINWGKTKAMVVKRGGGSCNVTVKGEKIEEVKVMKYLGAMFNEEGSCEDEVDSRIGLTCRTIGALRKEVVDRKELSKTTKLRVYNAIVKPTLLYGSETWTLQNRHMKKLQATEMRYLRKVEGVTRMDRMRSDDIRERLRQEDVLDTVLRKKKQWLKKIEEMSEERLAKRVYMEEMPGKRPRGRLRKRWEDDLT